MGSGCVDVYYGGDDVVVDDVDVNIDDDIDDDISQYCCLC